MRIETQRGIGCLPASQRETVFGATPMRAASSACERPSVERADLRSSGVTIGLTAHGTQRSEEGRERK